MDKKNLIKSFLNNDVDNWELAQNIYFYKNREELLSPSQAEMIKIFLDKSDDNQNISKDITENFESLMFEHISNISEHIIAYIKNNIPEFESGEVLKLYTHQHYINFKLANNVIIQLEYDRYPHFHIKSIWAKFYDVCSISEEKMKIVMKTIDEKKIEIIANNHEIILEKLKEFVKICKIDLSVEL